MLSQLHLIHRKAFNSLLVFLLLLIAAKPSLAEPASVVRDQDGAIYIWGGDVVPNSKYVVEIGGSIVSKRMISNECGIIKIADRPNLRTASAYKLNGSTLPDWWDVLTTTAPSCREGVLNIPAPSQVYYTEYQKAVGATSFTFNDVYISGLTPFTGYDIEMLDPTIRAAVSSNACGVVTIRQSATRQIPFTAENGIWLYGTDAVTQYLAQYPASDIPVSQGPLCKKGTLFKPN